MIAETGGRPRANLFDGALFRNHDRVTSGRHILVLLTHGCGDSFESAKPYVSACLAFSPRPLKLPRGDRAEHGMYQPWYLSHF